MKIDKRFGREAAKKLSTDNREVTFCEFDGTRLHFSVQEFWTMKTIALDKSVTEPKRVGRFHPGTVSRYYPMACYPVQLTNGDAEFFVETHRSQEVHERFEDEVHDRK